MTPDEPIEGIWMSTVALSDEEILRRVRETMEGWLKSSGLTPIAMLPSWGYLSLGMRDVRASPPPIPEDAKRRAANRAHAEEAKCKRKNLEHEELEKHCQQQRHDGLPVKSSPSPSLLDSSSDDDKSEAGRGTLDHLPDVGGMAPGASMSNPAFPGRGGEDALRPVIARPGAEADMPEARALGRRAVSPVGSTVEVERAAARAMQLPPQRVEGAPKHGEGRPAPADTEAVPLPPPLPLLRRRDAKRHAEAPALAPCKALTVSASSIAQWVVEAQAAIQHGAASVRADLKEPVAQGEATKAATEQAEGGEPTPHEAEAHESDGAKVSSVAEATETEVKAPQIPEAKATEAGAPGTTEAEVVEARAPGTIEAEVAEARAPGTTEARVVETGIARRSRRPRKQERRRCKPWYHPRSKARHHRRRAPGKWRSIRSPPTILPGGRGWRTPRQPASRSSQLRPLELEDQSLRKSLFLRWERGVWDQFWQHKDLLADANELLSTRSAEVEDLRLRCADAKAEVAMVREQAAPLAAQIKELEEELTRAASERDTFRSQAEQAEASAKAIAEQLGVEQGMHLLTKGALAEALKVVEASRVEALALKEKAKELEKEASRVAEASWVVVQCWKEKAEASRVEAQRWKEKAEGLENEVSWVAEASVMVQAVPEAEIGQHNVLQSAARTACEALEVEGA
ncbi:basal body protein 10-like [Miscanthus floridulus]|uniref:basal body protein 10-like n=1 Tax=Miscanthus floridulus TaxID=154761 RepID=UPI003457F5C4